MRFYVCSWRIRDCQLSISFDRGLRFDWILYEINSIFLSIVYILRRTCIRINQNRQRLSDLRHLIQVAIMPVVFLNIILRNKLWSLYINDEQFCIHIFDRLSLKPLTNQETLMRKHFKILIFSRECFTVCPFLETSWRK